MIAVGTTTGIVGFATTGCSLVNCTSPLQNEMPSGGALTAGTDYSGVGLNIFTDANPLLPPNNPFGTGATIDSGGIGMDITPDRSSTGATGLIVAGNLGPRECCGGVQGAIITGWNAMSVTGENTGIAVSATTAIAAQGVYGGSTLLPARTTAVRQRRNSTMRAISSSPGS
jgi:hypothetical protein